MKAGVLPLSWKRPDSAARRDIASIAFAVSSLEIFSRNILSEAERISALRATIPEASMLPSG